MNNEILLKCEDLTKNFYVKQKEIPVLKGIDLSINKGEIVVISGKSGTGKSTLLWILGGLERPTSGKLIFEGHSINDLSNEDLAVLRRKKFGIIFQNFNLLPSWTAFENVEAAMLHTGISKSVRKERAKTLLDELGLGDRLDNLPSELSIGQQQRVAIARAIANDPSIIIADEPTGDVDPETAKEIIAHLITPVKEKKVTLIVATHGVFPLNVANRIFYMNDGKLIQKSEP
jgi:putative ABC transport system ATP-binding protein